MPRTVTARDLKGLEFVSIVKDAYDKADLSENEARRVNSACGLAGLIGNFITENRCTYDDDVHSNYGYCSGYIKPKPLAEQVNILNLRGSFAQPRMELPTGAEGFFAIPRWQLFAPTYGQACEKVLNVLAGRGKLYNFETQLGPDRFRRSPTSVAYWEQIGNMQKDHDILVVPGQFGIRHRGRSVRRARELMENGEFGLGTFAVGIMLLTHENRLKHGDDLWIDAAGDEFYDTQRSGAAFDLAPFFSFYYDGLRFGMYWSDNARNRNASVSAWAVPQA